MVQVPCLNIESQNLHVDRRGMRRQGGHWVSHSNNSSSWLAVAWPSAQGLLLSMNSPQQLKETHIGWNNVCWTLIPRCSDMGCGGRAYWSFSFVELLSFLFCAFWATSRGSIWHFWAPKQNTKPLPYLHKGTIFSFLKLSDCRLLP